MLIHLLLPSSLESCLWVTKFSAVDPTVFRNLLDILETLNEPILLLLSLWETLKDSLWTWHNNYITIYLIEIATFILINMSVLLFSKSGTGVVETPVLDNVKHCFIQSVKKKDWVVSRESNVSNSSAGVLVISCIYSTARQVELPTCTCTLAVHIT